MKASEVNLRELIENETGNSFNKHNKISCPLHRDKTPSLSIDKKRNKWKCFSCGCGGDAIDFISELKGLNYIESCKYLNIDLNDEYKATVNEEEKVRNYINWCLEHMDNL